MKANREDSGKKDTNQQGEDRQQLEESAEERENQDLDFYLETIENLSKERDENYDLLLRKQAEFENYRKRIEKEKEDVRTAAQTEVIKELLGILDAFEKGLESLEEESNESELKTYRHGYELMLKEFRTVLEKFGVAEVPGAGTKFDPNIHEAVASEVTSEHNDGQILDEFRKGYKIGNRLLRPSQVRVAVKPDELPVGQEKGDAEEG